MQAKDVPVLRRAAMDFLARREHSFYELQQKLLIKFAEAPPELVREVMERLRDENLQSDKRFAESYIRYRKSRGFGYLHIRTDLARRRVQDTILSDCLFKDDEDWQQLAQQLVEKKLINEEKLDFGSKPHLRIMRLLESRGFSNLEIRKALEPRLNYSS